MNKIIVRVRGGLGNQLFCYAVARRLAVVNDAELVIDDVTGFVRDTRYSRRYALDHFNIPPRRATPGERLEPLERYRRGLAKFITRRRPFGKRRYLEQEGIAFDPRLLDFHPSGTVYLDGLWQSEGYFIDIADLIREDLRITPPDDVNNRRTRDKIQECNSVSMHVRWFDAPNSDARHNLDLDYYFKAIAYIRARVSNPHFFIFSDDTTAAATKLALPAGDFTCVTHNRGDENAFADLWLMTQCRHFITANSTFSWWGAWLGEGEGKIVLAPGFNLRGTKTSWGFSGLLPERWTLIP